MIPTHPSHANSTLELVGVRALECYMSDQMAAATAVLTKAQGWAVDQHVGYDGSVMIVAAHDGIGQMFALSGTSNRVELVQVHDDRTIPRGTYTNIEAALDTVLRLIPRERV